MIRRNGQSLLSSVYVLQLERSQGENDEISIVGIVGGAGHERRDEHHGCGERLLCSRASVLRTTPAGGSRFVCSRSMHLLHVQGDRVCASVLCM